MGQALIISRKSDEDYLLNLICFYAEIIKKCGVNVSRASKIKNNLSMGNLKKTNRKFICDYPTLFDTLLKQNLATIIVLKTIR